MAYDSGNIFAKILRGEIPCHKVYEDERTLAIMDVMPQADGHVLVIPKTPSRNLLDADPAEVAAAIRHVQRLAKAVQAAFDAVLARLGIDRPFVRELLREDLRIRAYLDQRFTADTPAEQRRLVDDWIAGLRRRSDVVDLYAPGVSGRTPGTAPPGRR